MISSTDSQLFASLCKLIAQGRTSPMAGAAIALQAARDLIRILPADRRLMSQALRHGISVLVADLIEAAGPGVYAAFHRADPITLLTVIRGPHLDILDMLAEDGFDLGVETQRIYRTAISHGSTELYDFIAARHPIDLSVLDMVSDCDPECAERLARDLLALSASGEIKWESALKREFLRTQSPELKRAAVLLWLAPSLGQSDLASHAPPAVAHILTHAGSAHGRLKLRRLEPSLPDMLGRPKSGRFYGLTASAFEAALRNR